VTVCGRKDQSPTAAGSSEPALVASAPPSASAAPVKPTGPSEPLNVIFITVDSLRADMPWTGYERKIAPNLEKLAKEGIVYTNAYSPSSYTAQSVAAYLSGRPASTLYRAGWFFTGYNQSNQFFPELLQKNGIRTLGWHAHMYFARGKGLEQGFDVWDLVPGITFNPNTDEHVTSEKMTKLGIELLGKPENTGKQFFAWAHYMDPHDEYKKHPESPDFGKKNRDRYDSEVFFTDLWIGKLLEFCAKQPWWKKTAVIISADHGEAFGEHDMWKHAFDVWQVLVRIPLIMKLPGAEPLRIDARRSMLDVTPTILELMGCVVKPRWNQPGEGSLRRWPAKDRTISGSSLRTATTGDEHPRATKADRARGAGSTSRSMSRRTWELDELSKKEPEKLAEMKKVFEDTFGRSCVRPRQHDADEGDCNGPIIRRRRSRLWWLALAAACAAPPALPPAPPPASPPAASGPSASATASAAPVPSPSEPPAPKAVQCAPDRGRQRARRHALAGLLPRHRAEPDGARKDLHQLLAELLDLELHGEERRGFLERKVSESAQAKRLLFHQISRIEHVFPRAPFGSGRPHPGDARAHVPEAREQRPRPGFFGLADRERHHVDAQTDNHVTATRSLAGARTAALVPRTNASSLPPLPRLTTNICHKESPDFARRMRQVRPRFPRSRRCPRLSAVIRKTWTGSDSDPW
jgi:arylsulfatase A-like enzyme